MTASSPQVSLGTQFLLHAAAPVLPNLLLGSQASYEMGPGDLSHGCLLSVARPLDAYLVSGSQSGAEKILGQLQAFHACFKIVIVAVSKLSGPRGI